MGLAYFRVSNQEFDTLKWLIVKHEADLTGPRARGYWFDQPSEYDYKAAKTVAQTLYHEAEIHAAARLELSENEAHSLSMLELELPSDEYDIPPSLFMISASPEILKAHLKFATRKLGATPEAAVDRIEAPARDPRFAGYLQKQLFHLQQALPKIWDFYRETYNAGASVVVIDLRARDLEIPDEIELEAY